MKFTVSFKIIKLNSILITYLPETKLLIISKLKLISNHFLFLWQQKYSNLIFKISSGHFDSKNNFYFLKIMSFFEWRLVQANHIQNYFWIMLSKKVIFVSLYLYSCVGQCLWKGQNIFSFIRLSIIFIFDIEKTLTIVHTIRKFSFILIWEYCNCLNWFYFQNFNLK